MGRGQMCGGSSGSRSSRTRFRGQPSERCFRVLCVLLLALFTWYLLDGLGCSLEDAFLRLSSNRALNLDVKLSLLFQASHLVFLPFVMYFLGRDILDAGSKEV